MLVTRIARDSKAATFMIHIMDEGAYYLPSFMKILSDFRKSSSNLMFCSVWHVSVRDGADACESIFELPKHLQATSTTIRNYIFSGTKEKDFNELYFTRRNVYNTLNPSKPTIYNYEVKPTGSNLVHNVNGANIAQYKFTENFEIDDQLCKSLESSGLFCKDVLISQPQTIPDNVGALSRAFNCLP